jgi:hypothetical protein
MDVLRINKICAKYIKKLLTQLEKSATVTPEIRKAVLDELNSMAREFAAMRKEHNPDGF